MIVCNTLFFFNNNTEIEHFLLKLNESLMGWSTSVYATKKVKDHFYLSLIMLLCFHQGCLGKLVSLETPCMVNVMLTFSNHYLIFLIMRNLLRPFFKWMKVKWSEVYSTKKLRTTSIWNNAAIIFIKDYGKIPQSLEPRYLELQFVKGTPTVS